MKILLATLLAALCLSSSADVLIYKQKVSYTITGAGSSSKASLAGYVILDPGQADAITLVNMDAKTKSFWVEYYYEDTDLNIVEGSLGKRFTVWTRTDWWFDTADNSHTTMVTLKGQNSPVLGPKIGTVTTWNVPIKATAVGTFIYPSDSGKPIMEESKGSMALDLKTTKAANFAGDDAGGAEDRVIQMLRAQGYTEI